MLTVNLNDDRNEKEPLLVNTTGRNGSFDNTQQPSYWSQLKFWEYTVESKWAISAIKGAAYFSIGIFILFCLLSVVQAVANTMHGVTGDKEPISDGNYLEMMVSKDASDGELALWWTVTLDSFIANLFIALYFLPKGFSEFKIFYNAAKKLYKHVLNDEIITDEKALLMTKIEVASFLIGSVVSALACAMIYQLNEEDDRGIANTISHEDAESIEDGMLYPSTTVASLTRFTSAIALVRMLLTWKLLPEQTHHSEKKSLIVKVMQLVFTAISLVSVAPLYAKTAKGLTSLGIHITNHSLRIFFNVWGTLGHEMLYINSAYDAPAQWATFHNNINIIYADDPSKRAWAHSSILLIAAVAGPSAYSMIDVSRSLGMPEWVTYCIGMNTALINFRAIMKVATPKVDDENKEDNGYEELPDDDRDSDIENKETSTGSPHSEISTSQQLTIAQVFYAALTGSSIVQQVAGKPYDDTDIRERPANTQFPFPKMCHYLSVCLWGEHPDAINNEIANRARNASLY